MHNKLRDLLFQKIPSESHEKASLYAILDSARSKNIYRNIDCDIHHNLFEGREAELLETVSPYLVSLKENEALTDLLLKEEYGNSSILFFYSHYDIETLSTFFRQYTKVTLDKKIAFFAFYDPRVFHRFMKRASDEELQDFFSLVSSYHCEETKCLEELISYTYKETLLKTKTLLVQDNT